MNPTTKSSENIVGAARTASLPTRAANPSTADLAQRTAAQAAIDTIPLQYQSSFYAAYADSANYPPPAAIPSNPNYGLLVRRTGELNPGFVSVAQNSALIGGSTRWLNNIFSGVYDEMFADADSNLMATQKDRDNFFEAVRGQPYGELIYRRYQLGEYADVSRPSQLIASVSYDLARQQALADIGNATGFTQFAGGMLGGFARPDQIGIAIASFGLSLGPAAARAYLAATSAERTVRYGTRVIQAERKVAERLGAMLDMRYGAGTATVQPLTLGERLRAASTAFTSSSTARQATNAVVGASKEATGLVPFMQIVQRAAQQSTSGIAAKTIGINAARAVGEGALYAGLDATIEYNTFGERTLGQTVDDFVANVAADVVFSGLMQTPGTIGKIRQEWQSMRSAQDFMKMPEAERAAAFDVLSKKYRNLAHPDLPKIEFVQDVNVPMIDEEGVRKGYTMRITEREADGSTRRTTVVRISNLNERLLEADLLVEAVNNAIVQRQIGLSGIDRELDATAKRFETTLNDLGQRQEIANRSWNMAREEYQAALEDIQISSEELIALQQAVDTAKSILDDANTQYNTAFDLYNQFNNTGRAADATQRRQAIETRFEQSINNVFMNQEFFKGIFGADDIVVRQALAISLIDDLRVNGRESYRYDANNVYFTEKTVLDPNGVEIPGEKIALPLSFRPNQSDVFDQLAEMFKTADPVGVGAAELYGRLVGDFKEFFNNPNVLTIGNTPISIDRMMQTSLFEALDREIAALTNDLVRYQREELNVNRDILKLDNAFLNRLQEIRDNADLSSAEKILEVDKYVKDQQAEMSRLVKTPFNIDLLQELINLKLRIEQSEFLLEDFESLTTTWFDDALEQIRGSIENDRRQLEISTRERNALVSKLGAKNREREQAVANYRQKVEDYTKRGRTFEPDKARDAFVDTDNTFDFLKTIEDTNFDRKDVVNEDLNQVNGILSEAMKETLESVAGGRGSISVRAVVNEFFGNIFDEITKRLGIVENAKGKMKTLRLAKRKEDSGIYYREAKQQLIDAGNPNPTNAQILEVENQLKDKDLQGISTSDQFKLIGMRALGGAITTIGTGLLFNQLPKLFGYNTTLVAALIGIEPQDKRIRGVVGESSVGGGYDITQYLDPSFVDAMRASSDTVLSDRATTVRLRRLVRNSTNARLAQDAIDMLNEIDGNSTPEDVRLANVRAIQMLLRGTRRNRPVRTGPSRTQPETNPDIADQPITETGAIDANDAQETQANIDALSEYYGLQDHVRVARARLLNLTDVMADDWRTLRRNAENLIGLRDGDALERIAVAVEETSRDTSRMLINDYNRHVGSWYDQVASMLDDSDRASWNALVQPIRNKYLFTPQTVDGLDGNGGGMLGAVMVGVMGAMMGLVIRDTIDGTNRVDDADVRSEWLREYRAAAPIEMNMIDRMTITFDNQMPTSGYLAGAYMPNNPNRALDYTRALELSPVALDRIRVGTASALEKQAFVNLNFTGAMLPVVNFERHVDERANMARLNDPSTTIRTTLAARQQFVDETMASGYTFEEAVQIATDAIPYQIANEFQEQSMRSFLKDHVPSYARDLETNMMDVLNKRYPKKSKKSAGQIGAIKGIASMTLQEQAAFAELDRARNPEKYKSPVEIRPLEVFMKPMNASDVFINSMLRPRQSSSIPGMQTPETNSQKR